MRQIIQAVLAVVLVLSALSFVAQAENDPIPHCFPCPQSR